MSEEEAKKESKGSPTAEAAKNPSAKPHKADPNAKAIFVKIYTPFQVYYEGDAVSFSAANESGPFDVLPGHRNFISMINPGDITVHVSYDKEDVKTIHIARGLMHVRDNRVTVFLDV